MKNSTENLLDCIMDLGEQMLISGGEVHWIEESIQRIFTQYRAVRTDVFIITSSMVVTVQGNDGNTYTQTRRIKETASNFEKLHQLNQLSRKICRELPSPQAIREELNAICEKTRPYPLWVEFLCYAGIAGAFTLFFGGNLSEAGVSIVVGLIVRLSMLLCNNTVGNKIFTKFIASFVATFIAFIGLKLGFIPSVDKVIIGNIMTLIPGIGLTNALKDLFVGDSMAGLLRTIEACIAALAIAAGYFTIAFITGGGLA